MGDDGPVTVLRCSDMSDVSAGGGRTEGLSPASSLPVPLLSSCLASHFPPCVLPLPPLISLHALNFIQLSLSLHPPPSTTSTTSQTPRWYTLVEIAQLRRKGENRRVVRRGGKGEKKERGMKEKVEGGREGGGALKRLTLAWTISQGSPSWGAILRGALAPGPWALGHGMP
ncbi:unnamed protein product [Pleuronectes platessa]|uniref:Uncharacterized protein n=1 Tax=Pleuronectes platessa TaxID=8262 RepID=A0A9N7V5D4_PLEPL|nr:unnamed protein product [Pleuronectes platessa]